jgi:hypothetical protein
MIYAHIDTHHDFRYDADIDYDTRYDCSANGCDEGGYPICRCGVITDARVKTVSTGAILDWLSSTIPADATDLDRYILERLIKHTMRADMFRVNVCGGYYGEEVDSVKIDTGGAGYADFARKIEVFNRLTTTTQQVQMILTLEYGYLLPEISAVKEWDVLEVPVKKVHADEDVLSRTVKEIVWKYVDDPPAHGIRGVVVPKGDGYRLVDGFHRYSAWTGKFEKRSYEPKSRKKKPATRHKIRVVGPKE